MAETKINLKLLLDTKANKVLFAEAGKEFVDFLFHIMSLPVGTIVKLLNVNGMVGSLGALYKSIESLSSDFFQSSISKDAVLKPKAGGITSSVNGGYVKGVVTYMVMDNLEVKPMSTISGITLINKFHVKDVSTLIEKEVDVGLKEGLAMLKASMETTDVLTTVFLSKRRCSPRK